MNRNIGKNMCFKKSSTERNSWCHTPFFTSAKINTLVLLRMKSGNILRVNTTLTSERIVLEFPNINGVKQSMLSTVVATSNLWSCNLVVLLTSLPVVCYRDQYRQRGYYRLWDGPTGSDVCLQREPSRAPTDQWLQHSKGWLHHAILHVQDWG